MDGRLYARHAVAIADRAKRNSSSDGVLVSDRSKAKSSAANMRPDRYGEDLQMLVMSVTALADSTSARILIGGAVALEGSLVCLSGRVCRITSVTKMRSEGELALETMIVSRPGVFSYTYHP